MASIAQAQASALADGSINAIGAGQQYSLVDANSLPVLLKLMTLAGGDFVKTATDRLNQLHKVASGAITDGLTFAPVRKEGDVYILEVGYEPDSPAARYYDFVNKGVNGTQVQNGSPYSFKTDTPSRAMVDAIAAWLTHGGKTIAANDVRRYGQIGNEKKYRIATDPEAQQRSIAYAIATSVKQKGLVPSYFFDNAVKEVLGPAFIESLAKGVAADIRLIIRSTFPAT